VNMVIHSPVPYRFRKLSDQICNIHTTSSFRLRGACLTQSCRIEKHSKSLRSASKMLALSGKLRHQVVLFLSQMLCSLNSVGFS
jgi:hypothetical protein